MSDAGDAALIGELLDAAGLGGTAPSHASSSPAPEPSSPPSKQPTPRKRKPAPKSSKSKRRKRTPDSDDESDIAEISDDEVEDIARMHNPPPRSRRSAATRSNLSPSTSSDDADEEEEEEEEEEFENPYPLEGKYKDQDDRQRLLQMTEIERENVLFQRSEELARLKERRDLAALVKARAKTDAGGKPRRSGREGQLRSEKAGKRDELSELKKRREEKSNATKVKTPTRPKFVGDKDQDSEDDGDQSHSPSRKKPDESSIRITHDNVTPIILTRNFFAQYCYYPAFESAITGCFTRVKVSERDNDYRFTRIEGLETVNKYMVEGVPVDQGLELSQGAHRKVITMDFASNSSVTLEEFNRYSRMVKDSGGYIASRKHLDRKISEIQDLQSYKLTNTDITAMIEKKKSLTRIPKNLVHEKTRLKQLRLAALSAGNTQEARNLEQQLVQLEELAQGSRDKGISRENEMFLKVNERNRKMNMVEMREAERRDAVERRKNALSTEVDPFSRRRTIPKTFYADLVSSRGTSPAPSSGVTTPTLAPAKSASILPEKLVLDARAAEKTPAVLLNGENATVDDVIAQADFGIDIEI